MPSQTEKEDNLPTTTVYASDQGPFMNKTCRQGVGSKQLVSASFGQRTDSIVLKSVQTLVSWAPLLSSNSSDMRSRTTSLCWSSCVQRAKVGRKELAAHMTGVAPMGAVPWDDVSLARGLLALQGVERPLTSLGSIRVSCLEFYHQPWR